MSRPTAGTRGSSPHARGTHNRGQGASASHRFIPACAGNAQHGCIRRSTSPVHPRMRGERARAMPARASAIGSSPHARGTRADYRRCRSGRRFIPACAGNASPARSGGPRGPVHPRMRGERSSYSLLSRFGAGSSPHARGTPRGARADRFPGRFIPACAGNARFPFRKSSEYTVHPRMRGERVSVGLDAARSSGSSPHARGTRLRAQLVRAGGRFIPACAGNA